MNPTAQSYLVNGVEVILVRDQHGARWQCGMCAGNCEHILKAAALMTLESWSSQETSELH